MAVPVCSLRPRAALPSDSVTAQGGGSPARIPNLFYPYADPVNPSIAPSLLAWQRAFAADQSAAFDRQGWAYYTREWADGWFPGYTDAWGGSLAGASGILYEQASTGGLRLHRERRLIATLVRQVIEVYRADAAFSARNASSSMGKRQATLRLSEGTYVVPAGQSRGALLRAILELDTHFGA